MEKLITQDFLTSEYLLYQKQYLENMRKSDEVLLELIHREIVENRSSQAGIRLADIGCSTGNLLYYLRQRHAALHLSGRDAFAEIIEKCKANPDLAGIDFAVMDIREPQSESFDIVVLNALLHFFKGMDLARIIANVSGCLHPGGLLVAFALLNPFEQEIHILEKSTWHPGGAVLNMHSQALFSTLMEDNGFEPAVFHPFNIPIDLPPPTNAADLTTYTRTTIDGQRLNFRGSIFQPWHHVTARKAASSPMPGGGHAL